MAEAFAEQGRLAATRVGGTRLDKAGRTCVFGKRRGCAPGRHRLFRSSRSDAVPRRLEILRDFDRFRKRVVDLNAQPANAEEAWLHVMTIHKAKGLEFDTVIVPGLGRRAKSDDHPLVLFHEWRQGDHFECLVAPIDETRAEPEALYRYLRGLERRKSDWERTRQLYVAATRARKRLHLMGHVGEKGVPAQGAPCSRTPVARPVGRRARSL